MRRVYLGKTYNARWIAMLNSYGFGEMTQHTEFPPKRTPFALDNSAFKYWRRGKPFPEKQYERNVEKVRASGMRPDFVVVPDIVAEGYKSLEFSLSWVDRLKDVGPLYLVVQDGMTPMGVEDELEPFAGVFVGGSYDWKLKTAGEWTEFAHALGRQCHLGRCGTEPLVRWALRIGVDSIDSCTPLWAEANFKRFIRGFDQSQHDLFGSKA